ncbi:hypothetical protein EGK70_012500 [Alcaligenes aquatilis]|uniref:hypothetical protein n=1 Tax=Alcaligenes aquatilis TaxID=323284 RepID=UPI000F67EAED|nr:hypothetical protein [Alcaligenes aquatilis]QXR34692.1 hypothetical protein EGK70_012500 [Alcaligenes aquatilis]
MELIPKNTLSPVNKKSRFTRTLFAITSLIWSSFIGMCVFLGLPILGFMLSRGKSHEVNDLLTELNINYLLDQLIQMDWVSLGGLYGFAYGLFSLLVKQREYFEQLRRRRFKQRMAGQGVGAAHSPLGEDTAP